MRGKYASFSRNHLLQQLNLDSSYYRGLGAGPWERPAGKTACDPACPSLGDGRRLWGTPGRAVSACPSRHSLSSFSISTVRLLASTMTRYSGAASTGPITVRMRKSLVWVCVYAPTPFQIPQLRETGDAAGGEQGGAEEETGGQVCISANLPSLPPGQSRLDPISPWT